MIQQWQPTGTPTRTTRLSSPKSTPARATTAAQRRLQRRHAERLCAGAATPEARAIADRLCNAWLGCGCDGLSIVNQAIAEAVAGDVEAQRWLQICAPDQLDDATWLDKLNGESDAVLDHLVEELAGM
jgi:hypothetical protein